MTRLEEAGYRARMATRTYRGRASLPPDGSTMSAARRAHTGFLPSVSGVGRITPGFNAPSRFRTCQWIDGEPSRDDACKCGQPSIAGSSYCQVHDARARPSLNRLDGTARTSA